MRAILIPTDIPLANGSCQCERGCPGRRFCFSSCSPRFVDPRAVQHPSPTVCGVRCVRSCFCCQRADAPRGLLLDRSCRSPSDRHQPLEKSGRKNTRPVLCPQHLAVKDSIYVLRSSVGHYGDNPNMGRFTAIVHNNADSLWYMCNDQMVSEGHQRISLARRSDGASAAFSEGVTPTACSTRSSVPHPRFRPQSVRGTTPLQSVRGSQQVIHQKHKQ